MHFDGKADMRITLIGASLDNDNMGVNVLAASSIKCILAGIPGADISLLDYGYEASRHIVKAGGREVEVGKLNIRFSKKLYLPNNIAVLLLLAATLRCIPSAYLRERLTGMNRWLRHLQEADMVLSIAGGDSFSDIYGIARLLYVSLPQVLALLMGKRLVLLPQTIGPFKGRGSRYVARFILERAERVYTRDYHSLDEIRGLLGNAPHSASFCHDVGFVLDPVEPRSVKDVSWPVWRDPDAPLVGLNVSGLLYRGGYTNNNMFGLRADYRALVHQAIELLIEKKGAAVLLVPHVFGAGPNAESDLSACHQIWQSFRDKFDGRLGIVARRYDQSELKYMIGRCDFFIGSRMHACIAALSQGIPTVSIAYSGKFIGVMETIGEKDAVADMRGLDQVETLAILENCFDRRKEVRERLAARMPGIKSSILGLFDSYNRGPASCSDMALPLRSGSDSHCELPDSDLQMVKGIKQT